MWKNILVPHDFSPCASCSLELAVELARVHAGQILLLHVSKLPENVPNDALIAPFGASLAVPLAEHTNSGALRRLEEIAARLRRDGLTVHTTAATGEVTEAILSAASDQKADVLVLGTHGRTGISHFLLGSVAKSLVRRSPIPVVTVRSSSPEAELTDEERDAEDELTG